MKSPWLSKPLNLVRQYMPMSSTPVKNLMVADCRGPYRFMDDTFYQFKLNSFLVCESGQARTLSVLSGVYTADDLVKEINSQVRIIFLSKNEPPDGIRAGKAPNGIFLVEAINKTDTVEFFESDNVGFII